jgi:hypothetical protein
MNTNKENPNEQPPPSNKMALEPSSIYSVYTSANTVHADTLEDDNRYRRAVLHAICNLYSPHTLGRYLIYTDFRKYR